MRRYPTADTVSVHSSDFVHNAEQELSTFRMLNTRDNLTDNQNRVNTIASLAINNNIDLVSSFYDLDSLKTQPFSNIYTILNRCNMIIFVDNRILKKKNNHGCSKNKKPVNITNEDFDSCTFFAYEYSKQLLNYITNYINRMHEAEMNNIDICLTNDTCIDICSEIIFDENTILKNTLYKKLEIQNKILFIPINKYKLKFTEYKLRGFCQIAEELGAKKIIIKFQKTNLSTKETKASANINAEKVLAGNLGFADTTSTKDEENRSYTLDYPAHNTINLNEELIKTKIRKKKLIVNEMMFSSNLELQYLISARCRHFITKYSAVFTFDSNYNIDKSLVTKFKTYGINLNLDLNQKTTCNDYISIITNVDFSDNDDNIENLSGCNVNLDEVGFNFLIQSLKDENFKTYGIFKVIDFINMYIEKILIKYRGEYNIVKSIQSKIEEHLVLDEYAEILSTYFNKNSQWVHLINYINLLRFRTKSYDKLGYLIIVNKAYNNSEERFWTIVKFIQGYCSKNKELCSNIENKYWKMLQPFNKKIIYYLKTKLNDEFLFANDFNWFNFLNFIECLKNYEDNISQYHENEEKYFTCLISNMHLGFKYWEYYTNIVPFIKRKYFALCYSDNLENINTEYFEYYFNFESFITSKIDSIDKLEEFIKAKVEKIALGKKLKEFLTTYLESDESINIMTHLLKIYDYFHSEGFNREFKYFKKKLNEILEENNQESILNLFKDELSNMTKKELIKSFIRKILVYNEKINLKKIPINYLGFSKLYSNYKSGVKSFEFKKNIIVFVKKLKSNITERLEVKTNLSFEYFKTNINSYYDLLIYLQDNERIRVPEYMFDEIY